VDLRRFPVATTTRFVTVALLCAAAIVGTFESLSQPLATDPSSSKYEFAVDSHRKVMGIRGCAVTFPFSLHSLTGLGLPINRASQHVSSGFAVDEVGLRPFSTPVTYMALNLFDSIRVSAIALVAGAALGGCGGGGSANSDDGVASTQSSATATSPTAASVGTSATGTSTGTGESSIASSSNADAQSAGLTSSVVDVTPVKSTPTSSSGSDQTATSSTDTSTIASTLGVPGTSQPTEPADPTTVVASSSSNNSIPAMPPRTTQAAARSGAGMNVGGLSPYSPEFPSIDLMKVSGAWLTQCSNTKGSNCNNFGTGASGWETLEESQLDLDSQGWIKSLPASTDTTVKYRYVTTTITAGGLPDGQYIVRYDGQGTLSYSAGGAKVASASTAGRDVVQFTAAKGGFFVTITATTPTNYLRNIRVYPPGGACANDYTTYAASASACGGSKGAYVAFESFPSTQQWFPQFISDMKGFRTLRFMDWMKTNTTMIANWSDRALPTDRNWDGVNGAPVETMVDLANSVGADPWMNIPPHATDDYVHQFASLVHQRLSPSLHLNLEYSNETWNYGFAATSWMLAQGKAAWPTQVAQGANVYYLELNWYARRLAQVCTIVKQEFGADASRVTCIANTQASLANMTQQVLACTYAAAELGKPCAKFYDAVAIAPYFGYYIGNPTYRPTIQTWYTDADGGLGKLFSEIDGADANGTSITAPLAALSKFPAGARGMSKGWMTTTKAVADTYGLPMWAYEGGQHLLPYQGDTDTKFYNLVLAANRDARMGTAYAQDLADWKASGGQVFTFYNHVATPSKYGFWGAKETLADTSNPKWKAVVQTRDATACWWSGC